MYRRETSTKISTLFSGSFDSAVNRRVINLISNMLFSVVAGRKICKSSSSLKTYTFSVWSAIFSSVVTHFKC